MQKKKRKKTNEKVEIISNNEFKKLIQMIAIVCIVFGAMYGLTALITNSGNKDNSDILKEEDTIAEIQYDEIILGELLNQNEKEYYVMANMKDDHYVALYNSYLNMYKTKDGALRVFTVDLSNVFNKNYLATKSKLDVSNLKDLRVSQTTLFKIKNNKIVEYYEGETKITDKLKTISK